MPQRAAATSPAAHNAAESPKAEAFSEQGALGGTCFCARLAPSGRHAKRCQPSIKRCRVSDPSALHTRLNSVESHLLMRVKLCKGGLPRGGCTRTQVQKYHCLSLSPPLPFSSSNTEINCKEIIGLARAGLLHTNFVRLTSRGQCSVWPLVGSTRMHFIRLKWQRLE